jgi:two-component system copper resistance phosphate regulon response regulator CusR
MAPVAHILLIEDDPDLARLLMFDLGEAGFQVMHASSGVAGLTCARETPPDLVLLDLGLPDFDGGLVVARLRVNNLVPIIALTARDALEEKVRLFELGVNDYLVKPAHPDELLARIQVQLRIRAVTRLIWGELELRLDQRRARYAGRELVLSAKEFNLLSILIRESGRVCSAAFLLEQAWGDQTDLPDDTKVVTVHLSNLREKLHAVGASRVLRTVRGLGYAVRLPND